MGKSQYWGRRETSLDSSATRFQKITHTFGTALASDLKAFSAEKHGCIFLQYIDDLLLTRQNQDCMEGTHLLLTLL
jgi:hypothetical protein